MNDILIRKAGINDLEDIRRLNNELFELNSWYFRNALVRANYTNIEKNIYDRY